MIGLFASGLSSWAVLALAGVTLAIGAWGTRRQAVRRQHTELQADSAAEIDVPVVAESRRPSAIFDDAEGRN